MKFKNYKYIKYKNFDKLQESLILKSDSPYMMRNDGEAFKVEYYIKSFFIDHPYLIRRGIKANRNDVIEVLHSGFKYLKWFYEHTKKGETQKGIERFLFLVKQNIEDFVNDSEDLKNTLQKISQFENDENFLFSKGNGLDTLEALEHINDAVNQEFLRFRLQSGFYDKNKYSIYFKVSSKGFDWSKLIDNFIISYKPVLDNITITKDEQVFDVATPYKVKGDSISAIGIDEYLNLNNPPLIESLYILNISDKFKHSLNKGKTLLECYSYSSPRALSKAIYSLDNGEEII